MLVSGLALCACSTPSSDVRGRTARAEVAPDDASALLIDSAGFLPAEAPTGDETTRVADLELPDDWDTCTHEEFARLVERTAAGVGRRRVDDRQLTALSRALAAEDERAARAAVLLARTRDPRAGEVLLARLELRVPEGVRPLAGDVLAADAFRAGAVARDAEARLEALVRGPGAHPVLDVRVACASAALARGRDGVVPFLLAVVREGTSTALARPDWRRVDWATPRMISLRDDAARALSARAGIACEFAAEAPLAEREAEIARLVRLLGAAAGK